MAKHLLSARAVQAAGNGDYTDGDGLILHVTAQGASWVLRYTSPTGRRRRLGLGAADRSSIEAAGASAKRARRKANGPDKGPVYAAQRQFRKSYDL